MNETRDLRELRALATEVAASVAGLDRHVAELLAALRAPVIEFPPPIPTRDDGPEPDATGDCARCIERGRRNRGGSPGGNAA